jgi:NADH-quinone oxidoreductase E subunit
MAAGGAEIPAEAIAFSSEARGEYERVLARYPVRRAALMPVLWLAQREFGYLSEAVILYVAALMELPVAWVASVASFYTMYYKRQMGRYHIQVCGSLPCALVGAGRIRRCIEGRLGIGLGETTADGRFSLSEVECLASCGTGPMVQVNDDYHENLDEAGTLALIDRLGRA